MKIKTLKDIRTRVCKECNKIINNGGRPNKSGLCTHHFRLNYQKEKNKRKKQK